jgi:hypothetical protein
MTRMPDTALRPSPAVRASISSDGLVLLDLDGGLVLASNVVGGRIWQLIEQRHPASDIARVLAAEFDVPHERAHADATTFIAALIARGLVSKDARA